MILQGPKTKIFMLTNKRWNVSKVADSALDFHRFVFSHSSEKKWTATDLQFSLNQMSCKHLFEANISKATCDSLLATNLQQYN